jgi:elongation factor P
VKVVDLRKGSTMERTFQSGDRVQDVRLDFHNVQYLYSDENLFHFMDLDTYEQPSISKFVLEDSAYYLKEGLELKLTFYEGEPIDIELPLTVDMGVVEAEAAVRGDTATGVTKKIVTDTGLQVQVPQFIQTGDTIRVNTQTGAYITRV